MHWCRVHYEDLNAKGYFNFHSAQTNNIVGLKKTYSQLHFSIVNVMGFSKSRTFVTLEMKFAIFETLP